MPRTIIIGIGLTMLVLSAMPFVASAHATPVTYTPAAGATLLEAPQEVRIYFSERIEPEASGIKIFSEDGSEAHAGKAAIDGTDPRVFHIAFQSRGEGVYTATWQVVSVDDGHFTRGSFSFLVDAEGKAFEGAAEGEVQVTYVTKVGEAWAHLLGLVGESLLIGVLMSYLFVVRPLSKRRPELTPALSAFHRYTRHTVLLGGLLLCVGGAVTLFRKTSELAALRSEDFATSLHVYVLSTGGSYLCLKMLAAVAFVLLFMLFRRSVCRAVRLSWVEVPLLGIVAYIIFLQSKVSHAAASFLYPDLSVAVTALHLFFKELLVGGVAVVAILVILLARISARTGASYALSLYDRLAAFALIVAGTSGAYITWLHLKRVENLAGTEWGERFLLLAVCGLLLGALRVGNQFIIGPKVASSSRMLSVAKSTLLVEVAVGVMVLFFSGYISITTPPFAVERYTYGLSQVDDGVRIDMGVHPYETGMFLISASNANGDAVALRDVVVSVSNLEKGIEANVVSVSRRTPYSVAFPEAALSPAGHWSVRVNAIKELGYDSNALFEVQYPEDVLATRYSDDVRSVDTFAYGAVAVGILIAVWGSLCFFVANRRLRVLNTMPSDQLRATASPFPYQLVALIVSALIVLLVIGLEAQVLSSDFKRACERDGYVWRQALPARDFEVVGKNSVLGCWVHDGHYHMPDYDEYLFHTSQY